MPFTNHGVDFWEKYHSYLMMKEHIMGNITEAKELDKTDPVIMIEHSLRTGSIIQDFYFKQVIDELRELRKERKLADAISDTQMASNQRLLEQRDKAVELLYELFNKWQEEYELIENDLDQEDYAYTVGLFINDLESLKKIISPSKSKEEE